ncbi:MAG: L-threonylcarbamoyladenylate synthase [Acidobacteriota bacterium]
MKYRGEIERALETLRRGGVIAFPTETFYALGADPRKRFALARLRRLKGRARSQPLLLLASSRAQALRLAGQPRPSHLQALARRLWPGPLTLVLPPSDRDLARALGNSSGIAVRVTSHPLARHLIRRYGFPITGTSANHTGAPPALSADQLGSCLRRRPDGVLDGGHTRGGRPSTILDLTSEPPRLLRTGAVSPSRIRPLLRPGRVAPSARGPASGG